ncbi:Methyltransferase domain-containing protein [Glycomyces harbinensis]|uniref:Methyltransferase domain-containing protein n=2 Tax=Glycomyces harbinensis TaxID=58114 RepID=A0A1G6XLH6_9ACTN|nr:Methyltransferase domain-containing protein [Glycomyces harbinensis]
MILDNLPIGKIACQLVKAGPSLAMPPNTMERQTTAMTHDNAEHHEFDRDYWERHWGDARPMTEDPNPHLVAETADATPGSALDAGCGTGTEAIWLAARGWQVTAVDITAAPLEQAAKRAARAGLGDRIDWVAADLVGWEPSSPFDLVTTHYAHPAMAQLDFYARIAAWVAPGGTLLIVGHAAADGHHHDRGSAHGHHPAEATATAPGITARLDTEAWTVVTAEERQSTVIDPHGRSHPLRDVVVRAVRK